MIGLQDALLKMILNVESVNINMFHLVMTDKIMSYTDRRFVAAANVNRLDVRNLYFVQYILNPHVFINTLGHGTEFDFCIGLRD